MLASTDIMYVAAPSDLLAQIYNKQFNTNGLLKQNQDHRDLLADL